MIEWINLEFPHEIGSDLRVNYLLAIYDDNEFSA